MVSPLLERETTLTTLQRCYRAATRGDGQLTLLRGEAGAGKTTVIARFLTGLDPGTRVLRGWCDGSATPRPLGPFIDMLADLPPIRRLRYGPPSTPGTPRRSTPDWSASSAMATPRCA